jgi:hypothetical protein
LSTFKLPKFDDVGCSWKLWEKSFQRFLGLHQLDYILEENFPELLWTIPGAKAANWQASTSSSGKRARHLRPEPNALACSLDEKRGGRMDAETLQSWIGRTEVQIDTVTPGPARARA